MDRIKGLRKKASNSFDALVPFGADSINVDITNVTNPTDTSINLNDTNVIVANGDTGSAAWTKFNRFRKRVINKFNDVDTAPVSGSTKLITSGAVYTAINSAIGGSY